MQIIFFTISLQSWANLSVILHTVYMAVLDYGYDPGRGVQMKLMTQAHKKRREIYFLKQSNFRDPWYMTERILAGVQKSYPSVPPCSSDYFTLNMCLIKSCLSVCQMCLIETGLDIWMRLMTKMQTKRKGGICKCAIAEHSNLMNGFLYFFLLSPDSFCHILNIFFNLASTKLWMQIFEISNSSIGTHQGDRKDAQNGSEA